LNYELDASIPSTMIRALVARQIIFLVRGELFFFVTHFLRQNVRIRQKQIYPNKAPSSTPASFELTAQGFSPSAHKQNYEFWRQETRRACVRILLPWVPFL
jgi:hypothetical protein